MVRKLAFAGMLALAFLGADKSHAESLMIAGGGNAASASPIVFIARQHGRAARHDRRRFRSPRVLAHAAPLELHPLLTVARRYLGRGNFTGFREAWCADSLRFWLRQAGYSIAGTDHRAISFARYGRPTAPHVGAVAVLRHHVGIVAGFDRRGVVLLSGNHARRVGLGVYSPRRILAFREPVP